MNFQRFTRTLIFPSFMLYGPFDRSFQYLRYSRKIQDSRFATLSQSRRCRLPLSIIGRLLNHPREAVHSPSENWFHSLRCLATQKGFLIRCLCLVAKARFPSHVEVRNNRMPSTSFPLSDVCDATLGYLKAYRSAMNERNAIHAGACSSKGKQRSGGLKQVLSQQFASQVTPLTLLSTEFFHRSL